LEYNTDLFDAATINRLIGRFQNLLQEIVSKSGSPDFGSTDSNDSRKAATIGRLE
jgi:hypothetical protein